MQIVSPRQVCSEGAESMHLSESCTFGWIDVLGPGGTSITTACSVYACINNLIFACVLPLAVILRVRGVRPCLAETARPGDQWKYNSHIGPRTTGLFVRTRIYLVRGEPGRRRSGRVAKCPEKDRMCPTVCVIFIYSCKWPRWHGRCQVSIFQISQHKKLVERYEVYLH